MKVLLIIASILAACHADVSELLGRGAYFADRSGAYVHDDSGRYIHDDNPYVHDDRPYVHTPDQFGPNGPGGPGGFGQETVNTLTRTYLPAEPVPVFAGTSFDPARTYLPVAAPPVVKVTPPPFRPIPVATINRPVVVPQGNARGGGPYKWNLDLSGNHKVENPHYEFQTKLR